MDQQELQRIAQLVEMNRQKMARIEEQITRLSEIRIEQLGVIASLKILSTEHVLNIRKLNPDVHRFVDSFLEVPPFFFDLSRASLLADFVRIWLAG